MRVWSLIGFGVMTLLAGVATAAPVAYLVTVDTSAVAGTNGFLSFQFSGGNQPFLPAQAQVVNFRTVGGVHREGRTTNGNVAGSLPNTVSFSNSTPMNEFFQPFRFGTKVSFILVLSGSAIDSPNSTSASGSTFGFGIYDRAEHPILTNEASGRVGEIHINVDGTVSPVVLSRTGKAGPSVVTFTRVEVPTDAIALRVLPGGPENERVIPDSLQ
jgi:hypothetical protein